MTDTRTDVAERGDGQSEGVKERKAHGHHQEAGDHDEYEIDHEEDKDGAGRLRRDEGVVDAHGEHSVGMMLMRERMSQTVGCQVMKSSSENPVVLCNEAVLKKAQRMASWRESPSAKMRMKQMAATEVKKMVR